MFTNFFANLVQTFHKTNKKVKKVMKLIKKNAIRPFFL